VPSLKNFDSFSTPQLSAYFKRRLLALDPEPDVKFMLAEAKIAHRQIRQPSRKRRIDIELIAGGIRENPNRA
jgi:hypothetical protein